MQIVRTCLHAAASLLVAMMCQGADSADLSWSPNARHEQSSLGNETTDSLEFANQANTFLRTCRKASNAQIAFVNRGLLKVSEFLKECSFETNNSIWCKELIRPNPASSSMFQCTYGMKQPHVLVHPDEKTWRNAFAAVNLIRELEAKGLAVKQVYNWWRPEPYNANVGGAKGRHPFATSIDVRFQTMRDMLSAHSQLCQWREEGKIRAVGYYGTTALHFGIGDTLGNTWGKSCP